MANILAMRKVTSLILTDVSQLASPNANGLGRGPEAKINAIKYVTSAMLIPPLPSASPAFTQANEIVAANVGGLYEPQSVTMVGRSPPQPANEIRFESVGAPLGILKNRLSNGPVPAGRYDPVPELGAVIV